MDGIEIVSWRETACRGEAGRRTYLEAHAEEEGVLISMG